MVLPEVEVSLIIAFATVVGFLFALLQYILVRKVETRPRSDGPSMSISSESVEKMHVIHEAVSDGAKAFLLAEYRICAIFVALFAIVVFILTSRQGNEWNTKVGGFTALAYVIGAATSIASGYVGMMVAVYSNIRTTIGASQGWNESFSNAFRAGTVVGFFLVSLGIASFCVLLRFIGLRFNFTHGADLAEKQELAKTLFECMAGFGLGGSTIALFGRVGGGIYTKAADVGADLAGKVIQGLPEDDPRNPATIADNVGDNVGDVAGMGADLFGSFAESTCAALVVSASSPELVESGWGAILFPVAISAAGILVCLFTSLIAGNIQKVKQEKDIEAVLKVQLGLSAILMVVVVYGIAMHFLPESFHIGGQVVTAKGSFLCVAVGLVGGCVIGFITEYYTSHSYGPVREIAQSCVTGAATNIIYGLSLGYKSAIIPITIISFAVYVSFHLGGMYGVALAALGMLGTLPTSLAIDVYGPICDNAGGIAEMAGCDPSVREKTDALDSAGNTTAAIGKGFAIGSAALVSLALFGAYVTRIQGAAVSSEVNILQPITFAALFMGAMLPYWFTAMTMKSVGIAAKEMVQEVARQFREHPEILEHKHDADHARCIKISTDASLREMIPPGLLVIFSPIVTGTFFGTSAVSGLLVGALTSGVQLAISQSNSGGAWDNAKKYIEKGALVVDGEVHRKGSESHKAAVVGDTVGDPLKDTSGPALNILMKLMAIISLVFADFFMSINGGRGVLRL